MTPFEMVREFHEAFGVDAPSAPTALTVERQMLRFALIEEEYSEYREAVVEPDGMDHVAKELADLLYVVLGTAVEHGITRFDEIFAEVHRSNMSKLGDDGRPVYRDDGKVLKGPRYTTADIKHLLTPATDATHPS
jgi:predicted HAD superfamily Cof-like phosphohydrolase